MSSLSALHTNDMKKRNKVKLKKSTYKRYETDKRDTKPTQTKRKVQSNDTKPTKETTKNLQTIRNLDMPILNDTKQETSKDKRYETATYDMIGSDKRYKNVQTIRNFGI